MVTSELDSEGRSGGAGIYAYNLSRELTRQGHHVDFVATVVDTTWNARTPFDVYELKFSRLWMIGMLKWSITAAASASHLINHNHYDVIHVHHPISYMYPLFSISRVPMVATLHTGWAFTNPRETMRRRIFDFFMDLFVCKRCKRVIAMNRHSENHLLRWFSREKVRYVPNGTNCNEFSKKKDGSDFRNKLSLHDEIVVLFTGRLEKGKGVENLLEAWKIVQNSIENRVWLVIVGDGTLREQLMNKARGLRNIVFTGSISRDELIAAYEESDLFVMPSEGGEGMPTVLLEAMAAGLPVIATKIPGIMELGDTEFVRLVPPGHAKELSSALLDFINDPRNLIQMGKKAALFARRFDWSTIASQIVEVYSSCLPKANG